MTWFLAGVLFTLLMEAGFLAAVGLDRLEDQLDKTGPAEVRPSCATTARREMGGVGTGTEVAHVAGRVGGASTLGRLDAAEPRGDSTASAAPGGSRGPHDHGDTVWPSAASSRPYDWAGARVAEGSGLLSRPPVTPARGFESRPARSECAPADKRGVAPATIGQSEAAAGVPVPGLAAPGSRNAAIYDEALTEPADPYMPQAERQGAGAGGRNPGLTAGSASVYDWAGAKDWAA